MSRTDKQVTVKQGTPIAKMKSVLSVDSVQEQFNTVLGKKASAFMASILDLYSTDDTLSKCEPKDVINCAMEAATLDLPINKNLGFAWIIGRWSSKAKRNVPAFQIGKNGITQLALRTGQYSRINSGVIYEGESVKLDRITGDVTISGEPKSDKAIGYIAYIKLINGFEKTLFWKYSQAENHAITYNPECKKAGKLVGNWAQHFNSRAQDALLKRLISKYGPMTTEMQQAISLERETYEFENDKDTANSESFADAVKTTAEVIDEETGEITDGEPELPELPEVFDV
jgi:recombination protein RecT